MTSFERIVGNVPDYQEFLTVDEMDKSSMQLAADYPDKAELLNLGVSRAGHPIYCLKIGKGSKNALMYGCAHPNEPMGAMMLEYFSRAIIEDETFLEDYDFTWYLIKSIDIDGTKLNENWFKGPFKLSNYARNYFRPASYEQVEWAFPITYKEYTFDRPIPETEVLMKLIDELEPPFIYSLHNAGFGGTYWYISTVYPDLWEKFHQVSRKQGIPLHLGEPEINFIVPYAPAIYPMINLDDQYDYFESLAEGSAKDLLDSGTSACGYALSKGQSPTVLVTELPYFFEPAIQSERELDFTRKEAYLEGIEFSYQEALIQEKYYEQVKGTGKTDNPFYKMAEMMISISKRNIDMSRRFVENNPDYNRPCKESEEFDNSKVKRFYNLLSWGTLLRGIELEIAKNQGDQTNLSARKDEVEEEFWKRADQLEKIMDYSFIPIKKLVTIQLECGLLVIDKINKA